jgi:hypothetical protein
VTGGPLYVLNYLSGFLWFLVQKSFNWPTFRKMKFRVYYKVWAQIFPKAETIGKRGPNRFLLMGKGKLTPDLRIRREKDFLMVFPPFG